MILLDINLKIILLNSKYSFSLQQNFSDLYLAKFEVFQQNHSFRVYQKFFVVAVGHTGSRRQRARHSAGDLH